MKKQALVALVVIVVAILAIIGIFVYNQYLSAHPLVKAPGVNEPIPGNQTAGWKTYTNTKYKYQFEYSGNDMELDVPGMGYEPINETSDEVVVADKSGYPEIVYISAPPTTAEEDVLSLDDLVKKVATGSPDEEISALSGERSVVLTYGAWDEKGPHGITLLDRSFIAENEKIIFLRHDGNTFMIQYSLDQGHVADQILSTFKFTK